MAILRWMLTFCGNFPPHPIIVTPVRYQESAALQPIADINGDGVGEVCIGTAGGGETVYMIDGATGEMIWEFGDPINYDQGDVNGIDGKKDWNNDGIVDILASASGNEFNGSGRFSIYLLDGRTGAQIWRIDDSQAKKMKDAVISYPGGGASTTRFSNATAAEIYAFNDLAQFQWTYATDASCWAIDLLYDTTGGKTVCCGRGHPGQGLCCGYFKRVTLVVRSSWWWIC
jgi:outer membrane protein assembly factor BamB